VEVLALAAVPQLLPSSPGIWYGWQQCMEDQGMAEAAVMEVFAANDGWQWQTSDRKKSINT